MTLIASGTDFCSTTAVATGTTGVPVLPRPPPPAAAAGVSPPAEHPAKASAPAMARHPRKQGYDDKRMESILFELLESQGLDRVERRRFSCWIKAEEHAGCAGETKRHCHGVNRDRGRPL